MKPLIVGFAPSATRPSGPRGALSGPVGARIAGWCGLSMREFLDRFDRINLFETIPDRTTRAACHHAAIRIAPKMVGRPRVVLLGHWQTVAFRIRRIAAYSWFMLALVDIPMNGGPETSTVLAAWTPHPSTRNRLYNDVREVGRARTFWKAFEKATRDDAA